MRRAGTVALRLEGDVVFYALGTGEYDELNCKCTLHLVCSVSQEQWHFAVPVESVLAVAETIRAISLGLRDTIRKPTESALFDNYGRLCMVVDEVINEVRCYMLVLANMACHIS